MSDVAVVLLVRFKSALSYDEIMKVVDSRIEDFRALSGLRQKFYVEDAASEEYGGLYLWESAQALTEYRESELRASIAAAYETIGEPRIDVLKVIRALRDDTGP